jgi:uncharacterized protein YcfJ
MTSRIAMIAMLAASLGAFAVAAGAQQDFAEVLGSTPVYRQVHVSSPQVQCIQQPVADAGLSSGNVVAGTILGGVAGGVVGNAVGRNSGQALATVVGAVFGAVAGNRLAGGGASASLDTQQQCRRLETDRIENRLDGYEVTYRYQGRLYHTRLREDPGPRLPVKIDVQPAVY